MIAWVEVGGDWVKEGGLRMKWRLVDVVLKESCLFV